MQSIRALVMCIALFSSSAATAQAMRFMDGNRLLTYLSGTGINLAMGHGFVVGVFDDLQTLSGADITQKFFCAPTEVTTGQLVDVVKKYLKENPAERHTAAAPQVMLAFVEAFPCKRP